MSEFEEDPIVRDALGRVAGDAVDEHAAYERVVAAAGRARRRRRTAIAGGWAAAVIVVVAGALAFTRGGEERIAPATVPPTVSTTVELPTVPTTVPATVVTTVPVTVPATRPPRTRTAAPTTTSPTPQTAAPTTPPATAAPTTTPHTYPPSTDPPSAPTTETFSSSGGSIEVRLDGDALSLAAPPSPANGYLSRVEDEGPDRVRVRFCGPEDSYRITVTVAGGQMVPDIEPGSATGSCG